MLGAYVPIQGREDEPLSIAIPQQWQNTFGLKKDGVDYCCIADQWYYWNERGDTPCEKPEGIDLSTWMTLDVSRLEPRLL